MEYLLYKCPCFNFFPNFVNKTCRSIIPRQLFGVEKEKKIKWNDRKIFYNFNWNIFSYHVISLIYLPNRNPAFGIIVHFFILVSK